MAWIENKAWLNGKSYLSVDELESDEFIHILYKICNILFSKEYFEDTIVFARSVLDFANDHEYITWKQANAILKIKTTEERRALYGSNTNRYIYRQSSTTDREHDRMSRMLFGDDTRAEELEGYTKCYRDDGSRYFAMPTGDEQLSDYI